MHTKCLILIKFNNIIECIICNKSALLPGEQCNAHLMHSTLICTLISIIWSSQLVCQLPACTPAHHTFPVTLIERERIQWSIQQNFHESDERKSDCCVQGGVTIYLLLATSEQDWFTQTCALCGAHISAWYYKLLFFKILCMHIPCWGMGSTPANILWTN